VFSMKNNKSKIVMKSTFKKVDVYLMISQIFGNKLLGDSTGNDI